MRGNNLSGMSNMLGSLIANVKVQWFTVLLHAWHHYDFTLQIHLSLLCYLAVNTIEYSLNSLVNRLASS